MIRRHLLTKDGRKFLDIDNPMAEYLRDPMNDGIYPLFDLNDFDKRNMNARVRKLFPFSTNVWLESLPSFIRILLGTEEFDKAVCVHIQLKCWHRTDSSCSRCNNTMRIYPDELRTVSDLINYAANAQNQSAQEILDQD